MVKLPPTSYDGYYDFNRSAPSSITGRAACRNYAIEGKDGPEKIIGYSIRNSNDSCSYFSQYMADFGLYFPIDTKNVSSDKKVTTECLDPDAYPNNLCQKISSVRTFDGFYTNNVVESELPAPVNKNDCRRTLFFRNNEITDFNSPEKLIGYGIRGPNTSKPNTCVFYKKGVSGKVASPPGEKTTSECTNMNAYPDNYCKLTPA
jgi:hypothetical protein